MPNASETLTDGQEAIGQSSKKLAQIYPVRAPFQSDLIHQIGPSRKPIIFDDYVPLDIDWQPMKVSELLVLL